MDASQVFLSTGRNFASLDAFLAENRARRVFLVCSPAFGRYPAGEYFRTLEKRTGIGVVIFSRFKPNPDFGSVLEGLRAFRDSGCDLIVALGGGSAIDVAKCVKLYAGFEPDALSALINSPGGLGSVLTGRVAVDGPGEPGSRIPFVAIPTTSGSGSESTRFAVVYLNGEKQSITSSLILPNAVLLDPRALETLPDYQRKSTMLDAVCHAVESFWSVNSTEKSLSLSAEALRMILSGLDEYLNNTAKGNACMMMAANIAGRAINITQTTAAHAMAYKLTTLFGISHGHAAALCLVALWPYMLEHLDSCVDERGTEHLETVFTRLSDLFGADSQPAGAQRFGRLLAGLDMPGLRTPRAYEYGILRKSVNPERLKNNPVSLDQDAIETLYRSIFENFA